MVVVALSLSQWAFAGGRQHVPKAYSCYDQYYDWYHHDADFPCGCIGSTEYDNLNRNIPEQDGEDSSENVCNIAFALYNMGKIDFPCGCLDFCGDHLDEDACVKKAALCTAPLIVYSAAPVRP